MIKVLISGASGVVGYGILKSLKKSGLDLFLYGSTIYTDSIAVAYCDEVLICPKTTEKDYISWLLETIKKHSINILIPSIEDDMICWDNNRETITKLGVKIILNNSELIKLCSDKWIFYKVLQKFIPEITIPTFEDINCVSFPLIAKPKRGFGSKGLYRIYNDDQLQNFKLTKHTEYIYQPLIGDDENEYSVSGFFNDKSELLNFFPIKRKLASAGYTESAVYEDIGFKQVLIKIADTFKPIGPTNFQFRTDKGELKLLEINPRISSATSIRTLLGYNESKFSIEYFYLNSSVNIKKNLKFSNLKVIRYIEDYLVDDCNN